MTLKGSQIAQVKEALFDAFDEAELRVLVREVLDERLDAIAGNGSLETTCFELVAWADRTNRIDELITGACRKRPHNVKLQQLRQDWPVWQQGLTGRTAPPAIAGEQPADAVAAPAALVPTAQPAPVTFVPPTQPPPAPVAPTQAAGPRATGTPGGIVAAIRRHPWWTLLILLAGIYLVSVSIAVVFITVVPIRLSGPIEPINAIAFSPDGGHIAGASSDARVYVWNAESGSLRYMLEGHQDRVNAVAFSPVISDGISPLGNILATAGDDGTIRLGRPSAGAELPEFADQGEPVIALAFSPDGQQLVSAGETSVVLWEVQPRMVRHRLAAAAGKVNAVAFSPNGELIVGAGEDGAMWVWNAADGSLVAKLQEADAINEPDGPRYAVAYSPDDRWLAGGGRDPRIVLWNVRTGNKIRSIDHLGRSVYALAVSPDSTLIASSGSPPPGIPGVPEPTSTLLLWDVPSGTLRTELGGHSQPIVAIQFSPAGDLLATGSLDGTVLLRKMPMQEWLSRFIELPPRNAPAPPAYWRAVP
jgi:hypothetical protein